MKLENIKEGSVFKNWADLCKTLEVEPRPSGKARKPQEKEFKRYFNWEKNGHKITITEIYEVPLEAKRKSIKSTKKLSLANNSTNLGQDEVLFTEDTKYLCKRLEEEMNLPFNESSLSVYNTIISQIEGNSLKELIAKSIINRLYLELSCVGKVGFGEAWWVTDSELYQATGMVSSSFYYAIRDPERFCRKVKGLEDEDLNIVLDHMGVDKEWLKKQRTRVLSYLTNDLHLISHTPNAYFLDMKTTRIRNGIAYTGSETYYPTLDEIEWINTKVIPEVMREHKDKEGFAYKSLSKVARDGKFVEMFKEWIPDYINRNLPTGWGHVTGVQKCHRIGFSPDVIEYAVKGQMCLLVQEREILDEISNALNSKIKSHVTDNRNEQTKRRHQKALEGKGKAKEEFIEARCRDSYIGVGFVVNKELHSEESTYRDYRSMRRGSKCSVSKVEKD